MDKDYNYIINEACEQLDAFGGNQYQFLGFFDLHEAHRLQPVSSQSGNDIKDFKFRHYPGGSKDTSIVFDEEQINMYKNSITHFDKKKFKGSMMLSILTIGRLWLFFILIMA